MVKNAWKLVDAFFDEYNLVDHHIKSYNDFVNHRIQDIIDITEPQILSLNNIDTLCNLKNFKSYINKIFGNKMIIINLSHDIKPIIEYPILCYLIYIFSCFIVKYNIQFFIFQCIIFYFY